MTGVKYAVTMIGVPLGSVPTAMDLTKIKNQIAEMVNGTLGITCVPQEILVSEIDILTQEEDARLEAARLANIQNNPSNYTLARQLQATNQTLSMKVEQLTKWIIENAAKLGVTPSTP
jgi:hypothetical protein